MRSYTPKIDIQIRKHIREKKLGISCKHNKICKNTECFNISRKNNDYCRPCGAIINICYEKGCYEKVDNRVSENSMFYNYCSYHRPKCKGCMKSKNSCRAISRGGWETGNIICGECILTDYSNYSYDYYR